MSKTIKAVFGAGDRTATCPQWQYDYNTRLEFVGLNLPEHFEVDFANSTAGQSQTVLGENNSVVIPAQYFIPGSTIFAWVYVVDGDSGYTRAQAIIPIATRATRTGEEPTPEQQSALDAAISAMNAAVDAVPDTVNAALQEAKESGEFDGAPGVSPTVAVNHVVGGHRVTITDVNGTQFFDVMDGTSGAAPRIVHFAKSGTPETISLATPLANFNDWVGDFEENGTPVMAIVDNDLMSVYPCCQSFNVAFGRKTFFYDARPDMTNEDSVYSSGEIRWISVLTSWDGIRSISYGTTALATVDSLSAEINMNSGIVGEAAAAPEQLEKLWKIPLSVMPRIPAYFDAQDDFLGSATACHWEKYKNNGVKELHLWLMVDMGLETGLSPYYLSLRVSDGVILENRPFTIN